MDTSKIKILLVVIISAFAAIYLGIAAATAQTEAIFWVVGALSIVFVLALDKHVWILIPITLQLFGQVTALPGAPAPWWGATAVTAVIFTLLFLMRRYDFRVRITWLEIAILLQMVAIGQAFLRNPTGLSIFGGDVVGGKPYIIFGFAFLAFILLSMVQTDLKIIGRVVIAMVLMAVLDGGIMLASVLVPSMAALVLPFYSGVAFTSARGGVAQDIDLGQSRLVGAKDIGQSLGLAAFTLFRPLATLNPLRLVPFLLMVSSLGFIFISGFRSVLAQLAAYAIVSSLVRRKVGDVIVGGMLGLLLLSLLIVTDSVKRLPFGAQRILSVLPVNVEDRAREDAKGSSDWRFEMWELALTTDRYVANKWLGDGFAFRADELAVMEEAAYGVSRRASRLDDQDLMMAKGSYHGFHVETIRMTGAFGLVCALIGLFIFFRYAWLQIQHFRGRPEWGYILYLCIPFLIHPFYLMLVFGAYRAGFPQILVAAGMLKVLDNIRVRELAEARLQQPASETSGAPVHGLPSNSGHPQPAMRTRLG